MTAARVPAEQLHDLRRRVEESQTRAVQLRERVISLCGRAYATRVTAKALRDKANRLSLQMEEASRKRDAALLRR
jgi:hypothetical protein